jgi:hypothetical protein
MSDGTASCDLTHTGRRRPHFDFLEAVAPTAICRRLKRFHNHKQSTGTRTIRWQSLERTAWLIQTLISRWPITTRARYGSMNWSGRDNNMRLNITFRARPALGL